MSKIGTGEGAQAYGHGLYFAENPKVARAYEGMLASNGYDPAVIARDALVESGGDHAKALSALEKSTPPKTGLPELDILTDNYGIAKQYMQDVIDGGSLPLPHKGRMYEVRINADPEDFLDWDKPLSQQSEKVRGALSTAYADDPVRSADIAYGNGSSIPADIMRNAHGPEVSKTLREAGIPGIRYLDQGSRFAGDGSRNYVLFRDDIIEIVKKYGIAAAASIYGMSNVQDAMASEGP